MSSLPKNIRDSASQLFFQDKESLQYSASLVISCLSHPDRAILSCFVEDSVDPEEAARYFLRVTSPPDGSTASMDAVSDFLLTWKLLIGKFHPVEAHSLSTEDRDIVYKRDGGACCVTHTPFETVSDVDARYVHVVPPHVLEDPHLSKSSSVLEMLKVFISEESFKKIPLSAAAGPSSRQELDNVWLLSADAFETMRTGTIRFTVPRWENHTEPALKQCYMVKTNRFIPRRDYKTAVNTRSMTLENRTPEQASIVSKELLSLHARFSKSFAWIGTAKYIGVQFDPVSQFQICNSMGGGILDWRIPDSQREELRFSTESEFNKYLTDPLRDEIRKRAAVSHDVRHDIVFTHGDLNPRNILAENGKITGIVDWENAGWFPEYWEYTKSHYTVRSLIRWLADLVDQVFEGYRDELHVENMLSDLLGPF
ncbi:hypothetical protein FQN55_008872 [Onygenales sp. PD_40]|nr:hypothetical protein FQN55_008872 [Onygenales sp. PD_40]